MQTFYTLGFDELKTDIKDYIANNSELLKDYNFEGSAISELIGVLAYVTQYQSFYLNMVANELFMTTAQLKKNVYKLATQLGYVPRRATAPRVIATLSNTFSATVTVPRYTEFSFGSTTLYTLSDKELAAGSSSTITLYAGDIVYNTISVPDINEQGYYISTSTDSQLSFTDALQDYLKYNLIDYEFIANDYLYVFDKYGSGTVENEWTPTNEENPVFNGKYYYLNFLDELQLMFDNGSFFYRPQPGSKLYVHYLLTSGTLYNNTSGTIEMTSSFTNSGYISATTGENLLENGTDPESLDSIKANAPLFYVTNNRAVNESDWNTVIQKYDSYDILQAIKLWGGNNEFINASYYITGDDSDYKDVGFVYISGIKNRLATEYTDAEYDYEYLTVDEKIEIEQFLNKYKILTLYFKWLDPNIIYFTPSVSVKLSSGFVDSATITYQIEDYLFNNYVGMNKDLNISNITKYIDGISNVVYSDIEYDLYVKVLNDGSYIPTSSTLSDNKGITYPEFKLIRFGNEITQGSVKGYFATFETLDTAATIFNNSTWTSGTNTGKIIDNNYQIYTTTLDGNWNASIKLDTAATLTSGDTLSIFANGATLVDLATVSEILYFRDVASLATLGYLVIDTSTTIGYLNYETGFCTLSTSLSSTLSGYTTYAVNFDFVNSIHVEATNAAMLSSTPINLTVI